MGRVDDKVALVTGAARGIGRTTASLLAREGARVVIADRDEAGGRAAAETIGDDASFLPLDVRDQVSWRDTIDAVVAADGRLDILVNNAGILLAGEGHGPEDTPVEEWDAVHSVNLKGVFLGCQQAIPAMRAHGGSIVNLSSIAGIIGTPHLTAYGASKGGVRQLTKTVALHCARAGYRIRCNSVHPGIIETEMGEAVLALGGGDVEAAREARRLMVPMGELGRPEDVAHAILFLASEEARYVTGAELVVDGGHTIY